MESNVRSIYYEPFMELLKHKHEISNKDAIFDYLHSIDHSDMHGLVVDFSKNLDIIESIFFSPIFKS